MRKSEELSSQRQKSVDPNEELCHLPDVDPAYLAEHRKRVHEFALRHTKSSDASIARRRKSLKVAALENRKLRTKEITMVHCLIVDMVAMHLDLDSSVVLDGVADSDVHLELLKSLLVPHGRSTVIFSYQLFPPPPIESGRDCAENIPFHRVVLTDGSEIELLGPNVVVSRIKRHIEIDQKNLYEELSFNKLVIPDNGIALDAFHKWLKIIGVDPVLALTIWGDLARKPSGVHTRNHFLGQVSAFGNFLSSTSDNLKMSRIGDLCVDESVISRVERHQDVCLILKHDPDLGAKVDKMVKIWYRKIEQVLESSHSIREEGDELGPLVELEFWRSLLATFTSLMSFMRSKSVRLALTVLGGVPPYGERGDDRKLRPHVEKWSSLRDSVEAVMLEAEESVRYLNDLSYALQAISTTSPPDLPDLLRSILKSIRMMYSASRYFDTTERANALPVKLSNLVVILFRSYLTENEERSLWMFPKREAIARINVCLDVYSQYQESFEAAKNSMSSDPQEKSWKCTEATVFASISVFCTHLTKVRHVLNRYLELALLHKCCLEGTDVLAKKLDMSLKTFVTQVADPLDDHNPNFSADLEKYENSVVNIEIELQELMLQTLNKCRYVRTALKVLDRFRDLNASCLCVNHEYFLQLKRLESEIQFLSKRYNLDRKSPPIPLTLPPVSGRLAWVYHILKKCERPMLEFQKIPSVIEHVGAQPTIRQYRCFSMVLLQYEYEHYNAWHSQIKTINSLLAAPVLRRDNLVLAVNWCDYLMETIQEADAMWKMDFDLPHTIVMLHVGYKDLLRNYYKLSEIVLRYNAFRRSISKLYLPLMRSLLYRLDVLIYPGEVELTWLSASLPEFCRSIAKRLADLHDFMEATSTYRIDEPMRRVSQLMLMKLPEGEPVGLADLIEMNSIHCERLLRELNTVIAVSETTAIEIVNKFVDEFDVPAVSEKYRWLDASVLNQPFDYVVQVVPHEQAFKLWDGPTAANVPRLHRDCMRVYCELFHRVTDALFAAVIKTCQTLRSRIVNEYNLTPVFSTELKLVESGLLLEPTLVDFEVAVRALTGQVTDLLRGLVVWGSNEVRESVSPRPDDPKPIPYHIIMQDNKDVMRFMQGLYGSVSLVEAEVNQFVKKFEAFNFLWTTDVNKEIGDFLSCKPDFSQIEVKIKMYLHYAKEVEDLPESCDIGCLQINAVPAKDGLRSHAQKWQKEISSILVMHYSRKIKTVQNYMGEREKVLNRSINDLDDVRMMMNCLSDVRRMSVDIDDDIDKITLTFNFLTTMNLDVPTDVIQAMDTLRFTSNNLKKKSVEVQRELENLKDSFEAQLLESLRVFIEDEANYHKNYDENGPTVSGISARDAADRVIVTMMQLDALLDRWKCITEGERLFGMSITDFPDLTEKKKQLQILNRLYNLYEQVERAMAKYQEVPWAEVDVEVMANELNDFQNKYKILPKFLKVYPAYAELVQNVDNLKEMCPLLELLAHPSLQERHWKRLGVITGADLEYDRPDFSLQHVLDAPLLLHKENVEDVCVGAQKELDVETKLNNIKAEWRSVELTFAEFKNRGELLLKGQETVEIIAQLEDSVMVLSSLFTNRYNAPFKKEIHIWLKKLAKTSETLENWLLVQNLWLYLEAVFISGDIAKQLSQEASRFSHIDSAWVRLMKRAQNVANAVETASDEANSDILVHLLEQLELCQKSLTGYLETLRRIFPRFYFVSDPTLLEILGEASDCHTIQNHLLNIFENVYMVEFDEKVHDRIVGMYSKEMEYVKFEEGVACIGAVEVWLASLLTATHTAINDVISQVASLIAQPDVNIIDILDNYPAQIGLLAIQMIWTRDAELALLRSRRDRRAIKDTNTSFLNLLNLLIEQTTRDLTKVERTKFETLVTIHVHQRDIFDQMSRKRVKSVGDFEWLKNMRFYWLKNDEQTNVAITDVTFCYQNEFMGCTERLVITPLTDRCYITLAQAIGMSMGGAPAGPAGTGKTETTKDMAKALGKYCVVFNCSDQMDFRGLGRIFKGLAQSGSWGCFDEFNRIELPVLSVAAQQISIVLNARKERKSSFIFSDGDTVPLNKEVGIFITMNPGYAGRQELPENLKMMFRPIAMMVPDRQIIMRVKLAACGFKENIPLASKFFTLYRLCEEQLSKQVHYDFGLRNILSVLRTLGAQKRANPKDSEDITVKNVLRYMNVSKLVDEDEKLFIDLVDDLFTTSKVKGSSHGDLQKSITQACVELTLVNHPPWNLKIVQLYETSLVRHGLMVLGPTGAGKTTCCRTLMHALTLSGTTHREVRMNPKAITAPQMFGRLDVATNDWTDGIFSVLWRKTLKVPKKESTWLILDGPVDAVWIENLNSVLDDNKTLTLANGDRITMAPNCKLVFEPDNVTNASPATISRMGMVFLSPSSMPWPAILKGWFLHQPTSFSTTLEPLFSKIFSDLLDYVTTKLHAVMVVGEALYISQCCNILQGLITPIPNQMMIPPKHWEKLFLFSLMWSLGAHLELPDRDLMDVFVRAHHSKLDWPKRKSGESIFEYFVDEVGNWQHWSQRVEEFSYPDDSVPDFLRILVPNMDNVRTVYLIKTIADLGKAVLLIGEPGTAKTVMMKSYLCELEPEYHLFKMYNFSSATTPNMVQRVLESYVEKRVGTRYGPPGGRKMTVFIDDLSMPVVNEWGDQVSNELVRQLMEAHGFYSLDRPGEFSTMADVQLVAAMIHPGGGRNDIPPRLKRQFVVLNCTLPSDLSMDKIFAVIAEGYFCGSRFHPDVVNLASRLVPLTRLAWQSAKAAMLPTPAKFHYVFNLRDLSRIWQGMLTVTQLGCQTKADLLELWRHECQRVISDRFVTIKERQWFDKKLLSVASDYLGDESNLLGAENRYFADFLRDPPEPQGDEPDNFVFEAPKIYELVPDWKILKNKLLEYQESYNENVRGSKLDLVMFLDAMRHLLIISRAIRTPRGSMVLVGVGGSGRQSLTKLATFIAGYKTFQIALTRSYNVSNFLEDLKALYILAGQQGQGVSFLFTENDIKDETFLDYLNNVLSAGEVANLFNKEEMEEIANNLIPVMKKEYPRRSPTIDTLYDYFLARAQSNLHVVLCFSPAGPKFRSRALKFPGLISGCTVDWFQNWPLDALLEVSQHLLVEFPVVCTPRVKIDLMEVMADAHVTANDACNEYFTRFRRLTHVTPKSFLSFLWAYKTMYTAKRDDINVLNNRMAAGVDKLEKAAVEVDKGKADLLIKQKEIDIAKAKATKVLVEVNKKRTETEKIQEKLKIDKERALTYSSSVEVKKIDVEMLLSNAKPTLRKAETALQTIKPSDIATVRTLSKPPYMITMIMDVVLILMQRKLGPLTYDEEHDFIAMNWNESLKVMADPRFQQKLVNFPKEKINAETIDLMRPYLRHPNYTEEKAKMSSGSVGGLLQWTRAMAVFYETYKKVRPLEADLKILTRDHQKAMDELNAAEESLMAQQKVLEERQRDFDKVSAEQKSLEKDAMTYKNKMDGASALINGLTGERQRWSEQLTQFQVQTERLVGDAMILTAFLCYAGPFNQEFREILVNKWIANLATRNIPSTPHMDIIQALTDPVEVGEWNVKGLPSDDLSVQNGILVQKAPRYPLLIDPQTQGKSWLINMEKDNELQVTTLNDRYFRNYLEDCVSLGRPLLIEDIEEELDPVLDNILEKNYVKIGTILKVNVGDKEIDIHRDFMLYITTKLPNPAFQPEVAARTAVIDFTVTMKGLEEQLLGRVIVSEENELEVQRVNLIKGVTSNRREMEQLETGLLQKLSSIEGSLLDDVELISLLNVSKDTSAGLRVRLEDARKTQEQLNAAREEFRPVATRGTILYFLIVDMAEVNCMYQTSLAQFLQRFQFSLAKSEKHAITSERIKIINDFLTYEIFRYKTRGMYVVNKFMFSLLLALKVDIERGAITNDEFQCLIRGGAALDLHGVPAKPYTWIPDQSWLNLVQLSTIRPFYGILEEVSKYEAKWKSWFNKDAPENETPPGDIYKNITEFKRLLLVRSWCADRTLSAGRQYIRHSLDARFAEPVVLNMDAMIAESRPDTPLLCLLSPGADPSPQIHRLARTMSVSCGAVSMGQGQEVHARSLIDHALTEGGWVLLQNCHLGLNYMSEVALRISSSEKIHSHFRLFLTTEVHCSFPISLLHISIKYTNEAPQGVRAGLIRTYADISQDTLELSDSPEYLPLLFTTSFFHTVVQERRKFGPLGWCIPYEFNASDWLASTTFVRQHLENLDRKASVSWPTLRYMIGEIQYGGRVTDDFDKRLLITLTRHWFTEAMLNADYQLYQGYPLLNFKTLAEYIGALSKFPDPDPPQVVGLHSNANIAFQTNAMRDVMASITSIQPKQGMSAGGTTREERVTLAVKDMLQKLPANYDPHETRLRLEEIEKERTGKTDGSFSPMLIFLRQEIDRMRLVLKRIRHSLQDLLLAIEGSIIMNEAVSEAMESIDEARVPATWLRGSWSSSSLGFWFTELIERNQQFSAWLTKGKLMNFWMTGFFNPQGFLTAMRQEVSRAHKWTLDSVLLTNIVLRQSKEEMTKPVLEGVVVYGLFLNGAGWDRRESLLVESTPKQLAVAMPLIHINAVSGAPSKQETSLYASPVYKKPQRTDLTYVTTLYLATKQPPQHWIMRGVALLCDTKF